MIEQLRSDFKEAMRNHDRIGKMVLSTLIGKCNLAEKEKKSALTDTEIITIVQKELKLEKEPLADFEKMGRLDLLDEAAAKIAVLERYLPKQLTTEEIQSMIDEAIQDMDLKNMGAVMKTLMPLFAGKADNKVVSQMIKDSVARATK